MKEFILTILGVIVFLFLLSIGISYYSKSKLTNDGFKIIEEYNTYMVVEKGNHTYIATPSGTYGLKWNYEHNPECQCMWIKNKINKVFQ